MLVGAIRRKATEEMSINESMNMTDEADKIGTVEAYKVGLDIIEQVSKMPTMSDFSPPPRPMKTKGIYSHIVSNIVDFEKTLSPDEEIGGRLVSAPGEGVFHINDVDICGPEILVFVGNNQHDKPVRILQHYSQLNLLLTALPKEKENSRRIGYLLEERVGKKPTQEG